MTLTVTELSQSREIARCVGGLMLGAQIHELRDIVDVIQAIVLLFVAADVIVRRVFRIRATGGGFVELQSVTKSYGEGAVR